MKINNVVVKNWTGDKWWDDVESRPDEPLIKVTMNMTLSWKEYQRMLSESRQQDILEIQ